jgi:cold shock CspA family protein
MEEGSEPHNEGRERGTIVSWDAMGMGRIRADNGDGLVLFYWSVLKGFRQLKAGQRVEFSRTRLGPRDAAGLVVAIPTDAGSN